MASFSYVDIGKALKSDVVRETTLACDFNWPFLPPYMGVIPSPKMAFIFPIFTIYIPKCEGKGCFPKFQIKSQLAVVVIFLDKWKEVIKVFSLNTIILS